MYTFVKTQLKRCPNVQGWYLKIKSSDIATIDEVHGRITVKAFLKYNNDPHLSKAVEEGKASPIFYPVNYGTMWIHTIEKYRHQYPVLLINSAGGWMMLDNDVVILQEIQSEKFVYPNDEVDNSEWITISKWPKAKHYYLQSNKNRMFNKCNTLEQAMKEALRFATKDHIQIKDANENELPPEP